MSEVNSVERIEKLVKGWNEATGLDLNPRAFDRELAVIALDPVRYPDDCLAILARYMQFNNARASAANYRVRLSLYNVLKEFSKFDSEWSLARAWNRNQVRKSAKAEFMQSLHRGEPDTGNTRTSRDIGLSLTQQLAKTFEKGN